MKGKRRNPFDRLKGAEGEPAAYIPPPASKAKRDRSWEREHNQGAVTYRGIPAELRQAIKATAEELGVPVDQVARVFLEYGLAGYRSGQLALRPQLRKARYTLFSEEATEE